MRLILGFRNFSKYTGSFFLSSTEHFLLQKCLEDFIEENTLPHSEFLQVSNIHYLVILLLSILENCIKKERRPGLLSLKV